MKAIGIILAGGNNKRMKELSYNRAIAAMPMVGTYRSIDFALSNMSNSRIQKVAVLTFKLFKVVGFWKKAGRFICIHPYYNR